MLRWILVLLTAAACLFAGVLGAMAGICAELHCPLSRENFNYTLKHGCVTGTLGGLFATGLLLFARRDRLWLLAILSAGLTLLFSFAVMWWDVVASLG
jgi:hypothetical protein